MIELETMTGSRVFLAAILFAAVTPAQAATPAACAVEGFWQVYAFLAGRPLSSAEKALLRTETLRRDKIPANECKAFRKQTALLGAPNPVLRADRLADVQNVVWFALQPNDPRRALLSRVAPIVLEDRARRIVIRRRAIEAFMASRAFAASKWGLKTPVSTVEREVAELRSDYARTKPEVIQFIQYQESYWEALRRGWAGKPQGWRRTTLGKLGRPKTRNELDARTAQLQLAVVAEDVRADQSAALQRLAARTQSRNTAINAAIVKSGILAGIYGSR